MKLLMFSMALLLPFLAFAADAPVLDERGDGGGFEFVTQVTGAELEATPSWEDKQPNPPLAPRVAMSVARDFLSTVSDQFTTWNISAVTLKNAAGDKWYWLVNFRPAAGWGRNYSGLDLTVLIDGKVHSSVVGKVKKGRTEPPTSDALEAVPPDDVGRSRVYHKAIERAELGENEVVALLNRFDLESSSDARKETDMYLEAELVMLKGDIDRLRKPAHVDPGPEEPNPKAKERRDRVLDVLTHRAVLAAEMYDFLWKVEQVKRIAGVPVAPTDP